MGKHRLLAACLALVLCFAPVALAETAASPAPFTSQDVDQISDGFATVGDYVKALSPTSYSWVYQGAATGETWLTLTTNGADGLEAGEATVSVALDDQLIDGKETGECTTLPEGLQDHDAWLVDARWISADYPLPAIRGVKPGAAQADVIKAFFSHSADAPDYSAQDINPAVDDTWQIGDNVMLGGASFESEDGGVDFVYSWCTLDAPEEWREYNQLVYHISGGTVQSITLRYSSDPE
jgi:hypothetical protein